eukprot:scaffold449_cov138-Cylindrotheca_fusiformis.AAC.14
MGSSFNACPCFSIAPMGPTNYSTRLNFNAAGHVVVKDFYSTNRKQLFSAVRQGSTSMPHT